MNSLEPAVFWLACTLLWLAAAYGCHVVFRKICPVFAAEHSWETAGMIAVLVAALLYAALAS